ncbi:unnamed protein product [Closterium sp. NIES-53]
MTGDDNNSSANGGGGGAYGGLLQLVESPIPEQKIFNSLPFPLVLTPRVLPNPASTSAPSAPPASLSANASDASAPASSSSSPQAVSLATSASSPSDAAAPHVSDAVAWIRANREWLLDTWQLHGAVLLRGLPLESPCDFNEVVEAFGLDELPYVGGAAPRTKVIGPRFRTLSPLPDPFLSLLFPPSTPFPPSPPPSPSLLPSHPIPSPSARFPPRTPLSPLPSPGFPPAPRHELFRLHSASPHLTSRLLTALNLPYLPLALLS